MRRLVIAGMFLSVFLSPRVEAQISFQPQMLVLDVQTQRDVVREIKISNVGKKEKEIWLEMEYRWPGPCEDKLDAWVEVTPDHFSLKAGETKKIWVKFKRTDKDIKGECQMSLFAREQIKSAVMLNIKIGMSIYVRLNSGSEAKGKILAVTKSQASNGGWIIRTQWQNTGSMFLVPFGIAWLEDKAGERVWQQELRAAKPLGPGKQGMLEWQMQPATCAKGHEIKVQLFWGTMYGMVGKIAASKTASLEISK